MKKYLVIRFYQYASPDVVFQSNDEANAQGYADIMTKEDSDHKYVVYKSNEEL